MLIAVGAILAFAVDYDLVGVNIQAIGGILVVVGTLGLLLSLLFIASFAPFGRHAVHEDHYVRQNPYDQHRG
jgi:hypothetical protein